MSLMTRTYTQIYRSGKYSEQSWIFWPVWSNGWVLVCELSDSRSGLKIFRFPASFEERVPWDSANYRVWIHSETGTCNDENIQSNAPSWEILRTHLAYLVILAKTVANTWTSDFAPASCKKFLEIQRTIDFGFTPKYVRDITKTYSQMHRTEGYSEHSSITQPVWPNA